MNITHQIMTYHPQRFGGVQIRENGRAIGSMKSKAAAKALCDAINVREAPRRAQEDAAWEDHRRR